MSVAVLTPGAEQSPQVTEVLASARRVPLLGTEVGATLEWCVEVGRAAPPMGEGRTRLLWELLAAVAALDVSAARMLEPHLDALGILREAGTDLGQLQDPWNIGMVEATVDASWGVFAAEASGVRLDATIDGDVWVLNGTKPWCSLAGDVSHALVTAFRRAASALRGGHASRECSPAPR